MDVLLLALGLNAGLDVVVDVTRGVESEIDVVAEMDVEVGVKVEGVQTTICVPKVVGRGRDEVT